MLKKIHHIGIAVTDFEKIKVVLSRYFGIPIERKINIEDRKRTANLCRIGDIWFEFLTPTSKDSKLKELIDKYGECITHFAFSVNDIEECRKLLPAGAVLPTRESRVGDWKVADLKEDYNFGVKIQIVQEKN